MTTILSAVQPTGHLHLGNYLGAIRHWVKLQQQAKENFFCIVDLHAITVPQDPKSLTEATLDTAALYVAAGINPEKSHIFYQSAVREHTELAWVLGTHTPLGWLNRMTQFKEKAGKHKENSNLGLYGYPVLMAADILLYDADQVPVGEDQKQHIELARDIAGAFNRAYEQEFFTLPEPVMVGGATRVMSLRDGTKKMSKSDISDQSRINLTDENDVIEKKIKKAKSDSVEGVSYDPETRPEVANFVNIYSEITGAKKEEVVRQFANSNFSEVKKALAEVLVEQLSPIRNEFQRLRNDRGYLEQILKQGIDQARQKAATQMSKVRKIVGFLDIH